MNKELSNETLIFFNGVSSLETRAISGDRLGVIKQDIHSEQNSSPAGGYLIQAEEVKISSFSCGILKSGAASGIISELEKT